MKIAVIGAGVVGITSAYELTLAGHDVSVYERRSAAAEESSFANGGVFAPGYLGSTAEPGMASKFISQCLNPRSPFRIGMPISMKDIRWMYKFFNLCTPEKFALKQSQLQKLAVLSRCRMQEVTDSLQLEHEQGEG